MTSAFRLIMALVFLGPAAVSPARILSVNAEGSAEFPTIQAAVDQARDGDVVEIRPGAYRGPGNWDIEVRDWLAGRRSDAGPRAITLRSIDPNDLGVVNATIVDCRDSQGSPHRAFRLIGRSRGITLQGLTITGARGGPSGGAIQCLGSVTVSRCHIGDCSASRGGALFCGGLWEDESQAYPTGGMVATVRILDCRIEHCTAHRGGGIYASSDGVLVKGCEIDHNRADSNGGGIAGDVTVVDLENNIIRGNRAAEGGGIWLFETAATIADSWLAGNWAALYGGAVCVRNTSYLGTPQVIVRGSTLVGNKTDGECGGLFLQALEPEESPGVYGWVNSSILWHNMDGTGSGLAAQRIGPIEASYSCIQEASSAKPLGRSGLADDPLMVRLPDDGGDGWGDDPTTTTVDESLNDDFGDPHLLPASPCIESGDPAVRASLWAVDLDGQPRRMDESVEIGVDEYTASGVAIVRPRGGEILTGGMATEVIWQAPASGHPLRVEFSADGGERWQVLDANPLYTGRLMWQVPQDVWSDACLIRVTPVSSWAFLEGATCDPFSIHPAGLQANIASGWRTAGADFQRTGRSRNAGPVIGCLRWQFDARTAITSGPVVGLNGRIHLATWPGQVCTLDADGRLLWACDTHDDIWGSPTVADDGTLYVSTAGGRVHEISPDGRRLRSFFVSPADDSPAILPDGGVVLGSGILDLATGSFLSFQRFWGNDQSLTLASPAVGPDGTVYAAAWDMPGLYALSAVWSPRAPKWKWSLIPEAQGQPFAGPVVGDNGLVYQTFVYDSRLYAVEGTTGELAWTADLAALDVQDSDRRLLGHESWSEPVLGPDGTVYAGLDDPFIRAVDPATGQIKWFTRLGDRARCFAMAVDREGYLFAAGDDGCLYVVNAQGNEVSRFESDTPLSCPVIAAEGLLLVVGEKGPGLDEAADVLYAIAADPTGSVLRPPEDLQTSRDQRE
jgi:outer membrane protein assembly factor BamB